MQSMIVYTVISYFDTSDRSIYSFAQGLLNFLVVPLLRYKNVYGMLLSSGAPSKVQERLPVYVMLLSSGHVK